MKEYRFKSLMKCGDVLVEVLDKDHVIVKKKIKEREPPYIPSIDSFQKQYPPDSLGKYERLGSSIEEVIDFFMERKECDNHE